MPGSEDLAVTISVAGLHVPGRLQLPPSPSGLVIFVHGSGSSRLSPRNMAVARDLRRAGIGTLLFDLLTDEEGADRRNIFDVELLAARLLAVTDWLMETKLPTLEVNPRLPVGYFGASTGAGAALVAAAQSSRDIAAVVSRGGRPDLAGRSLAAVHSPTLLIVGGRDEQILELNEQAQIMMHCRTRLDVLPGATHLFEQPGALTRVSQLATDWFQDSFIPAIAV